jgi:hypothetical protein
MPIDGLGLRIEPYRHASGASIVHSVMGERSSWVNYRTIWDSFISIQLHPAGSDNGD